MLRHVMPRRRPCARAPAAGALPSRRALSGSARPDELTALRALLEKQQDMLTQVMHKMDRLEKRGFVKRAKSPADGRQVLVSLTAKGRKKVDAALIDHAANENAVLAGLSSTQQRELIDLLRALSHAVGGTQGS